ncbi:MAG: ABC transporter ATP-binding protein [Kiritimatiellia bacterium]|jgi:ABC-type lipoprotein export system ATPase subunit|nr:ABC transporter ATP-binding protein [Kiritimatiellia bacterium]MDP6631072.1 ABC transporter ATP-binding protein [Kiritimatiellia bacterium]MDP6810028.1 ABC transporter ATP-binding protein [Kiritimatiellia bacterium]MDP7024799.1 ABC transporter ATP-binding protein [Kiritimatiellia bacterium]
MIELNDISKSYRSARGTPVEVLKGMSVSVEAGEFVSVTGPSGCGKSTLLLIAGSLLHPDGGSVVIDGRDFTAMNSDDKAHQRAETIGFVFQRFHLLPYLTVRENILAGGVALKRSSDEVSGRAEELMEKLGMVRRADHLPGELSVGEMQRTALARAFLNGPKVILADEPTGNLDPENAEIVMKALSGFAGEGGAVLMVTHHPADADRADRQLKM